MMKEYTCPYDENVLIRIMEPTDGMAYIYARQLFNERGNIFHVPCSMNPAIVLVDSEWHDQPWMSEENVTAEIALQVAKLYVNNASPRIVGNVAYRVLKKSHLAGAASFLRNKLMKELNIDPEEAASGE